MFRNFFILFCLFLGSVAVFGQITEPAAPKTDCDSPIVLNDTVYISLQSPQGFGKKQELKSSKKDPYCFDKEHNTIWYQFSAPYDATLSFEIIPDCIKDDYDFLLFKKPSQSDLCQKISSKEIKPIRSCISRNDKSIGSQTGLKYGFSNNYVHSGPGKSWSAPLEVKKGETFLLILDNVYPNGCGHSLHLHYTPKKVLRQGLNLNVIVKDKESGDLLNGNIRIRAGLDTATYPNTSSCFHPLKSSQKILVEIIRKGYFPVMEEVEVKIGQTGTISKTFEMQKIEAGKSFILQNILFHGGESRFLPESHAALKTLLVFMLDNPNVYIEIQGHVNFPYPWGGRPDVPYNVKLSEERALAVFKFLKQNGVEEERMTHIGFGNTKMLYPYATEESEMRYNRRVEIKVLDIPQD